VDILAAWTSQAAQPAPIVGVPVPVIGLPPTDTTPEYGMMSVTSMSSRHLTGAAALLVAMHPDWAPTCQRTSTCSWTDATATAGCSSLTARRAA
jgi:hypothetical protein